eukprot:TRINITY_DN11992_c0_g1_i2.p1 TRINITY_DN11992_c0_g1~~TRINITY_DN11992_c0_g1_i2.p1  ORF type:complete len:284 (+),score=43.96 TRINITY_DN11992_c0_g1_i2:97-852(+)
MARVMRAALAVLGASCVCGALSAFAGPFMVGKTSSHASRDARVILHSLAEEDGLMSAINNGNRDRIARAVEAMPDAPKDAFKKLDGEWQIKWDSNTFGPTQKTMLKFMCPQLPSVMVEFYRQYNHVSGGTYRWIQAFTMPGFERTNAALLMQGPIKKGKKGNEASVTLDTVQLVASNAGTSESKEAMRSLGLDRYMKPQKIKDAEAMTVQIGYISDDTQVQIDEVGSKFVMSKMSESYGIPYVYDEKKSTY